MTQEHFETSISRTEAISLWHISLHDTVALLAHPGAHHKALLTQAHALHRAQTINSDDLSDLLEMADGALAYAVETMLDFECDD